MEPIRSNAERLDWWRTLRNAREREQRKHPRRKVHMAVKMDTGHSQLRDCIMLDISPGGARIAIDDPQNVPDEMKIWLTSHGGPYRHCRLVWRSDAEIGVRFIGIPDRGMISRVEEYRANAFACEGRAEKADDPAIKREYKELASQWQYIADQFAQHE
jgi:hypothetical protein